MKRHRSEEDYLETILILQKNKGNVKAIDIANEMSFSKASVSIAMKKLKEKGLIIINSNLNILLTDEGRKIAESVLDKHHIISDFLMSIGVSRQQALEDACEIEHIISDETFTCLKNLKK